MKRRRWCKQRTKNKTDNMEEPYPKGGWIERACSYVCVYVFIVPRYWNVCVLFCVCWKNVCLQLVFVSLPFPFHSSYRFVPFFFLFRFHCRFCVFDKIIIQKWYFCASHDFFFACLFPSSVCSFVHTLARSFATFYFFSMISVTILLQPSEKIATTTS